MDDEHLVLLSPSEVRCSPHFIFHRGAATEEPNGLRFCKKSIKYESIVHIPNDINEGEPMPPIFLLEHHWRYYLFVPENPVEVAASVTSVLRPACHHPYICHPIALSQETTFSSLLSLCSM
jgi:hypothetical protein